MEFWQDLFSGQGFMPRRFCGIWDSSLIGLHVVSDVTIWLSYLWIPMVMLWSYGAHRRALQMQKAVLWILVLYVVFITACGWTHFFDALMFWTPAYRINGLVRAVTAVASLATAVSLVRLVPLAITAPITIVTQQAALHQQQRWLRDILDAATGGRLHLCETEDELPAPGPSAPIAALDIATPSDLRSLRRLLRAATDGLGFGSSRIEDLNTAVHEAAMNALLHAGGGAVTVYGAPDGLRIWIEDNGAGIPLDKLPIATLKQGYSTGRSAGQGWFLILSFVDAAYLLTSPQGTRIVLEMRTAPERPVPASTAVGGDVGFAG